MRFVVCSLLCFALASSAFSDEAEYRLTFSGGWASEPLPGGAHFTALVGATHSAPDAIFSVGSLATQGVENVAEIGSSTVLINEINQMIQQGTAGSVIFRPGDVGPVQIVSHDFTISSEYPLISLLTMIAPSPDWMVGVNSLELRKGGTWVDEIVVELNSYDAGTEDGTRYSFSNPPTNPHAPIDILDSAVPTNPLFGFGSIATLTVTRLDTNEFAVGDVNRDGVVDLLDISPFVDVLNSSSFQIEADIDCDGEVTLLDVQPFVILLSN